MNEAETRAELIDPALHAAGWGVVADSRTRREVIAPGRIMGGGRRASAKAADYVLVYRNTKLAVVEAKAWDQPLTVRTAEIRVVAVADGAQAGDVITELAGKALGGRLVVSDHSTVRDHAAAAGAAVTDLNWLLGQVKQG